MKYVYLKREKSSFIIIIYNAPLTDCAGLGPVRATNIRRKGRSERERVAFRRGWRFPLGIEHSPRKSENLPPSEKKQFPSSIMPNSGVGGAHMIHVYR